MGTIVVALEEEGKGEVGRMKEWEEGRGNRDGEAGRKSPLTDKHTA